MQPGVGRDLGAMYGAGKTRDLGKRTSCLSTGTIHGGQIVKVDEFKTWLRHFVLHGAMRATERVGRR